MSESSVPMTWEQLKSHVGFCWALGALMKSMDPIYEVLFRGHAWPALQGHLWSSKMRSFTQTEGRIGPKAGEVFTGHLCFNAEEKNRSVPKHHPISQIHPISHSSHFHRQRRRHLRPPPLLFDEQRGSIVARTFGPLDLGTDPSPSDPEKGFKPSGEAEGRSNQTQMDSIFCFRKAGPSNNWIWVCSFGKDILGGPFEL